MLEKTLESPLDCKEIKPVNPKGNQSWIFIGRTDAEAEAPILWPPDAKNWLLRKDPDAGKVWRQEEKGMTEDDTFRWHHWFTGHEFEQSPGVGDGQGALACCSPWDCKELDTTEQLNWTGRRWTSLCSSCTAKSLKSSTFPFSGCPDCSLSLKNLSCYALGWLSFSAPGDTIHSLSSELSRQSLDYFCFHYYLKHTSS